MKIKELLKRLEGVHTIESVMDTLGSDRKHAIYQIYRLRKEGYVKTKRLSDNKRVYNISFANRLKGTSYHEVINEHSPLKISTQKIHKIYGKSPSLEETLIYAIKTKSLRKILASLPLFKKINDWSRLYSLAKENQIERHVGALYDLARLFMKVRRMSSRFRNNSLPKHKDSYRYVIPDLRSEDFKDIQKTWKIYLPFNKEDLEVYKR